MTLASSLVPLTPFNSLWESNSIISTVPAPFLGLPGDLTLGTQRTSEPTPPRSDRSPGSSGPTGPPATDHLPGAGGARSGAARVRKTMPHLLRLLQEVLVVCATEGQLSAGGDSFTLYVAMQVTLPPEDGDLRPKSAAWLRPGRERMLVAHTTGLRESTAALNMVLERLTIVG
ncbi:UNVERIFIED_CONTAM: hypothetical protein Sindi_1736200 [Sesamum indicum]